MSLFMRMMAKGKICMKRREEEEGRKFCWVADRNAGAALTKVFLGAM